MAKDIVDQIKDALDSILIKILVFGPDVSLISSDERTAKLQRKRIEIRENLEALGHNVKYAEELVDPNIDGAGSNMFFQELVIMKEYDLIVILLGSPGANSEATVIAVRPDLAPKAALYMDSDHQGGFVGEACRNASDFGAEFHTYNYPADLDLCHLMGFVKNRVSIIQKIKYLL